jgi:hypothetical protein
VRFDQTCRNLISFGGALANFIGSEMSQVWHRRFLQATKSYIFPRVGKAAKQEPRGMKIYDPLPFG